MIKMLRFLLSVLCSASLIHCSAHTNLVPLGKGNLEANLSLGGPIISVSDMNLPAPYATLGINYGLTDNSNIDGNLHLTSMFYQIIGADFGATFFPVLHQGNIPTWGIQPRILTFASVKPGVDDRFRIYPLVSTSAAWPLMGGLIYTGFDWIIPLTSPDYDEDASPTIFSPFIGYRWSIGEKTRLVTEFKWNAANVQSDQLAVEYLSIGGKGAFGVLFSIEKEL